MRLENIRLIVSDLDGTLFNSDEESYQISKELKNLIRKIEKVGVRFTIATGRPEFSTRWVIGDLALKTPYIAYNGGLILGNNEEILFKKDFEIENWLDFVEQIDTVGGTVLLYMDDGIYYYRQTKAVEIYMKKEKIQCQAFDLDEHRHNLVKKILLIGNNDVHKAVWDEYLPLDIGEKYRFLVSEHNYMEIVEKGISKGYALAILREELSISNEQVLGIGNQMNDKELLEESHIGVAVANADDQLKELADMVTKGSFEKGVIEVLEKILTAKENVLMKKRSMSHGEMV